MTPSALTIGNFDGVHVGHRLLMRRAIGVAQENGWEPAVLTFNPHPTRLVAPDRAPRLLTTIDQRCALIRSLGIDRILVLPFTPEISQFSPDQFVRQILMERLNSRAILVGENFRFGNRAAGNTTTLRVLGHQHGYRTEVVSPVHLRGGMVSSSEVRRLIEMGNVSRAARLLDRRYSIEGSIVSGFGIGSKQTVPTLNLDTTAEVLPAKGVYITRTFDLHSTRHWDSITNVGNRPTFNGDRLTIETYLLSEFSGATPSAIRLEFLRRVRAERKFESPDGLKSQIIRDVAQAQSYFRRVRAAGITWPAGIPPSELKQEDLQACPA